MKKTLVFIASFLLILTLTGCTKTKEFTVSFETNAPEKINAVTVKEGAEVALPEAPEKEGYIFEGWHLGEEPFDSKTKVSEDLVLTAYWSLDLGEEVIPDSKKAYEVTFLFHSGIKDATIKVEENKKVKEPAKPSRTGYTFEGWYLGKKKFDFKTKIKKDIKLEAKWGKVVEKETLKENPKETPKEDPKPVNVSSIKLNSSEITLEKGKTFQIKTTFTPSNSTDTTLTYKSSNTNVATVDSKGVVTAKANNKSVATITVTSHNGKTASLKVNAINSVTSGRMVFDNAPRTNHAITQHGNGGQSAITYKLLLVGEDYKSITWTQTGTGGSTMSNCSGLKCTIKAANDGITYKRTVTLTAKIEKYDGKFLEIKQNVVIEGPFSITHSNGNNPITNLDILHEETKSVIALAGRVGYFNLHSPHSTISVTRVNPRYDITCNLDAATIPREFTATSDAGQVYKFNVTCKARQ